MLYRLLLALVAASAVVQASTSSFRIQGHHSRINAVDVQLIGQHRPSLVNHQSIIHQSLKQSLEGHFVDFKIDNYDIHGEEHGYPTAIFNGYITVDIALSRDALVEKLQTADEMQFYFVVPVESVPELSTEGEVLAQNITSCQNAGVLLPNATCVCPNFVSGAQCETINCQHYGILSNGQCSCAPGTYSLYCEQRGCLPQVQGNLDANAQTFITVVSTKSSMSKDIMYMINNVYQTIQDIEKESNNIIKTYILTTFRLNGNAFQLDTRDYDNVQDYMRDLNGISTGMADEDQPVLQAASAAQGFSATMLPFSTVYVFADSADINGTSANYLTSSTNIENTLIHQTNTWRNRLILILSQSTAKSLDSYGNYFDVFRRVTKATHGDLLLIDKDEHDALFTHQFYQRLYQSTTILARYGVDCSKDMTITCPDVETYDGVMMLVTVDHNHTVPDFLNGTNGPVDSLYGSKHVELMPMRDVIKVIGNPTKTTTCNIRIFLNTGLDAYVSYSANPKIDVGSSWSTNDASMYASAFITHADPTSVHMQYLDITSGLQIGNTVALTTRTDECTYNLQSANTVKCPVTSGAFTQELFYTDTEGKKTSRVLPGYCGSLDKVSPPAFQCLNGGTLKGGTCTCTNLFNGINCGDPVCFNGGTINPFPGNGLPLCNCPFGFQGDHCDILSCPKPSTDNFDTYSRSLALVMQNSFSQNGVLSSINSGISILLNSLKGSDAFSDYILTTFNVISDWDQSNPRPVIMTDKYGNSSDFISAVSNVNFSNTNSKTQPLYDALMATLTAVDHTKSSIFVFTDSPSSLNLTEYNHIVYEAIMRQLEISIILTVPFTTDITKCPSAADVKTYGDLARQTGGQIINLCQNYVPDNSGDPIIQFFTLYGGTHHHTETIKQAYQGDCTGGVTTVFTDSLTSSDSVFFYVNSPSIPYFTVTVFDNDKNQQLGNALYGTVPYLGIYIITPGLMNTNGYTLNIKPRDSAWKGSCSLKVVEKTVITAFIGYTPDPAQDKVVSNPWYALYGNPVVHLSSAFQSAPTVSFKVYDNNEVLVYNSTATRRKSTCHYEYFADVPFTCNQAYGDFMMTVSAQTPELFLQRSQRAFCYIEEGACLNGGTQKAGKCQCQPGFSGDYCENPTCQNGGVAENFRCKCPPLYDGLSCEYAMCSTWNFMETHDYQQHEFRQITFILEKTNSMLLVNQNLVQFIDDFVAISDANGVPKQYTLITFDDEVVNNVVSTSNTKQFVAMFKHAFDTFKTTNATATLLAKAVNEAHKITVQPPAIYYVFTSQQYSLPDGSRANSLNQVVGTQVNVFYTPNDEYPKQPDLSVYVIPRTSGGRVITTAANTVYGLEQVLLSSLTENGLIYDKGHKTCSSGWKDTFVVEPNAQTVVITITGNDVNANAAVAMKDGAGKSLPTTSVTSNIFSSSTTLVLSYDVASYDTSKAWSFSVKTNIVDNVEDCYVQVRVKSPLHIIPGFTSDIHSDFPNAAPFTGIVSGGDKSYMTFRVTQSSLDYDVDTVVTSLTAYATDFNYDNNDKQIYTGTIVPRNGLTCANQFVSNFMQIPASGYQRIYVTGNNVFNNGTFTRLMPFQFPSASKDKNRCTPGGTMGPTGECNCDDNHRGDYCSDLVCQNGGTPSYGVCACRNGFSGDYCEKGTCDYLECSTSTTQAMETTSAITLTSPASSPTSTTTSATSPSSATTASSAPTSATSPTSTTTSTSPSSATTSSNPTSSTTGPTSTTGSSTTATPIVASTTTAKTITSTVVTTASTGSSSSSASTPTSPTTTSTGSTTTTTAKILTPPPRCDPPSTTYLLTFDMIFNDQSDIGAQRALVKNMASTVWLGNGPSRFLLRGANSTGLVSDGGNVTNSAELDDDMDDLQFVSGNDIMPPDIGQSYLDLAASEEDTAYTTSEAPPLLITFFNRNVPAPLTDGFNALSNKGYRLIAIDVSGIPGTIDPNTFTIFGQFYHFLKTTAETTTWLTQQLCILKPYGSKDE